MRLTSMMGCLVVVGLLGCGAGDGAGPEVPPAGEEIHLPGPSIQPLLLAAGITIGLVGILTAAAVRLFVREPVRGAPGEGNMGLLRSGAVEDSNVDLTAELVNMMTAQRAYQANAQTIKTQDQMMSTLVNLR